MITPADKNWHAYLYLRDNGHLAFLRKQKMCEDFFAGNQWDQAVRDQLVSEDKPVLTFNKVMSTLAAVFGEQLSNQADIAFLPGKAGTQEVADALSKVFLHIDADNQLSYLQSEVFADGTITSRGFFDARVTFDDNMLGEVDISILNPANVLIDADASSYDPEDWGEVMTTKWMSLEEIRANYPGVKGINRLKDRQQSTQYMGHDSLDRNTYTFGGDARQGDELQDEDAQRLRRRFRVIERQHRVLRQAPHFVNTETGDIRLVPADWDQARVTLFLNTTGLDIINRPRRDIRWTTSVEDIVLHDDWSPYNYFTVVPYFPYFRRGTTLGIVEHLLDPQRLYNKTRSQIMHILNTTANSGWKVKANSLQNMTIEDLERVGAKTGVVLELTDTSDAEKITPNPIPSGLDRVAFEADSDMKDISGVSDSMRGFDREDVAAKAIAAKQVKGSLNFAKPMSNMSYSLEILARNVLDMIQDFYTEERLLQITGGGLNAGAEELAINQVTPEGEIINDLTVGEYSVRVTNVPSRDTMEQGGFTQAMEMRTNGIAIPDDILVELSSLPRKGEIAKRIQELNGGGEITPEQQQMAQLEVETKQLENQKLQVEAQEIQATTQLQMARAQAEALATQQGPEGTDAAAAAKVQGELQLKAQELALKREELEAEITLKTEELEMEREIATEKLRLEKAKAAEDIELKRETANQQAAIQKATAESNADLQKQKMKQDANKPKPAATAKKKDA